MRDTEKHCCTEEIDGVTVYHSLNHHIRLCFDKENGPLKGISDENKKESLKKYTKQNLKWCNLRELITIFISEPRSCDYDLDIAFFTAFPSHRDNTQKEHHTIYTKVLEKHCGITVVSSRYEKQKKHTKCPNCNQKFPLPTYKEKETDVTLAVQIISDLHMKKPDLIVIMIPHSSIL